MKTEVQPSFRTLLLVAGVAACLAVFPPPVDAQYFGRNKVQYDRFDFRVLDTPNFEIHFYPAAAAAIEDVARMSERWYERHARLFGHEIGDRRPLIFYANHPDFQQTNVLQGTIGEATGGVTEGLRDRVIMPLGSSYADTDHVLGHELVHSFQFDMAGRGRGGLQGLMQLPLWFVEGMAEYLSIGSESAHTAMWLRDALLKEEFPTTRMMTRDMQRYFPYRFGHAFLAWVGGTWGDEAVGELLRVAVRSGFQSASVAVLGLPADTVSVRWREAVEAHYAPLMEGKTPPAEVGELLLSPATGAGRQNIAPSLSPDGRYIAFLSERDLFTIELFLADAETGRILRTLTSSVRDAHFDAIRFLDSSGGWSPDGDRIAVVVFTEGRNSIHFYSVPDGRLLERLTVPREIGEIRGPTYSPDGNTLAFSGQVGGKSDLFLVDIRTGDLTRLTEDGHTALQPTFSPDGSTLAFVTDRGPATDFEQLTFGPETLALIDLETREIEVLAPFEGAEHWNPQFTPDGGSLYFLADPDGFRDIYRIDLGTRELRRVTTAATAISGITFAAPALAVAPETGALAFSVFDGGEYHIFGMGAEDALGEPVTPAQATRLLGRMLPGAAEPPGGRVDALLADAQVGLPPVGAYLAEGARAYDPGLGLEWIGQAAAGVGQDQFGTFVAGSAAALFGDMLGNRTLFTALHAQGEIQDIGGQVFYQDVERRWNWGAGLSHIPFRFFRTATGRDEDGNVTFIRDLQRIRQTQAMGMMQYPFSSIRRVEGSLGYTRFGFDTRREIFVFDPLGRLISHDRLDGDSPDALNLGQASVAFVEDNSFFGFTSPVRGWRARYEVSQTVGSVSYTQGLFDHRRYFAPFQQLTFAARGMHIGRYNLSGDEFGLIQPFYLGWETVMRGYSSRSFEVQECTVIDAGGGCPEFDRLLGQRIGVVNLEFRVPLFGVERFGLINFPMLPTDIVLFGDAGVAWDTGDGADFRFDQRTTDRVPVFSTGASARINLLGAFIMEIYYAYPWQRPEKGGHFGFHLAPGW